jgi:hypothetical protein
MVANDGTDAAPRSRAFAWGLRGWAVGSAIVLGSFFKIYFLNKISILK